MLPQSSRTMVGRSGIVALLYVLDVCAWFVMLGGISAWQYQCNTGSAGQCLNAAVQLNW